MATIYALHDYNVELKKQGAFEIKVEEVEKLNKEGYGIHICVNQFSGARKKDNLTKICYWLADIDGGLKTEQKRLILNLPLKPSIIVETKRGYHCYWRAIDATPKNFVEIQKGLIKRLGADEACKDVTRLLRMPGTYHMKDPEKPFLIKIIYKSDKAYTEKKMLCAYQLPKPTFKPVRIQGSNSDFMDESKWERIFKISRIGEGNRNSTFARYVFWLKDAGLTSFEIDNIINGLNQKLSQPLEQNEIDILLRSKGI